MSPEEYLTIGKLGKWLDLKPKTIRNKMANGTFIKGIHYFSPDGMGPRFKWSAVVTWLEEKEPEDIKTTQNNKGHWLGSDYPAFPLDRHRI